jgi:hypothetical protein
MIVDVNAILLIEKKKKNNNKLIVTTNKEIIKVFPIQEKNLGEVVEASSILSEIGGKHVEIPSEVMAKPLVPHCRRNRNAIGRRRRYAKCSNKCGYGKGKSIGGDQ